MSEQKRFSLRSHKRPVTWARPSSSPRLPLVTRSPPIKMVLAFLSGFRKRSRAWCAFGSDCSQRTDRSMSTDALRACPSCGNEFSGALEFCPICMLRKALARGLESGESPGTGETVKPTAEQAVRRFEHYELVTGENGKPVELGRGAMGVTYKAVDIDLHCLVTLKVISEKFLDDELAWLRFFTRSPPGGERSSPECCLGFPPRQNRSELLLRDGVCRGGNARESHQTLRPA